jgi:hypothetical protein
MSSTTNAAPLLQDPVTQRTATAHRQVRELRRNLVALPIPPGQRDTLELYRKNLHGRIARRPLTVPCAHCGLTLQQPDRYDMRVRSLAMQVSDRLTIGLYNQWPFLRAGI